MKPLEGTVEAYVQEFRANDVLLDLNHPLAGQTLHVFVKIAYLQSPVPEEYVQKKAHDDGHDKTYFPLVQQYGLCYNSLTVQR